MTEYTIRDLVDKMSAATMSSQLALYPSPRKDTFDVFYADTVVSKILIKEVKPLLIYPDSINITYKKKKIVELLQSLSETKLTKNYKKCRSKIIKRLGLFPYHHDDHDLWRKLTSYNSIFRSQKRKNHE